MDAHFYYRRHTGLLCEHCGRGPKRHRRIKGEGEFEGWTRYQCTRGVTPLTPPQGESDA